MMGWRVALAFALVVVASAGARADSEPARGGLLIVTPAALAGSLGEFVAFKNERLETELVTLEDALTASEGVATVPGSRLGDCWAHAIGYYFEQEKLGAIEPTRNWYPASIFFQGMKFMVYGDPTIPVGMRAD